MLAQQAQSSELESQHFVKWIWWHTLKIPAPSGGLEIAILDRQPHNESEVILRI